VQVRPVVLQIVLMVTSSAIAVVVLSGGNLSSALRGIFFFLGAGGMLVMFYRWRLHGDRLAAALVLTAFATWALAVAVASATGSVDPGAPASWVAALALLIGISGGLVTLARMRQERQRDGNSSD
jgi:peptidoglycan/LPS O-acetylase OafA/YrhL